MGTVTDPAGSDQRLAGEFALMRKARRLVDVTPDEAAYLAGLHRDFRSFAAETDIVRKGDALSAAYVICHGWAISYDLHPDGRRQIVAHLLPGDLIGYYINFTDRAESHIAAQTELRVVALTEQTISRLHEDMPRLAAALSWLQHREATILAEQVVRLGRRSAYERMADFLLETWLRLKLIGEAEDHNYELPLTQHDLADTLGLSTVHVNRTLQKLRGDGLISLAEGRVVLLDAKRLKEVANYEQFFVEHFAV